MIDLLGSNQVNELGTGSATPPVRTGIVRRLHAQATAAETSAVLESMLRDQTSRTDILELEDIGTSQLAASQVALQSHRVLGELYVVVRVD
jgi:hypothetical protein